MAFDVSRTAQTTARDRWSFRWSGRFRTSLLPVGQTMYIWGGGWNQDDAGAGIEAVTLGVSKRWAEYAAWQTEQYDFDQTRYQSHDGLDCSGYIGWSLYNVFHTRNGETGYVVGASKMARACAARGWGYLVQETTDRVIYAVWKGMSG